MSNPTKETSAFRLAQVRERIAEHMDAILEEFKSGAKVTVLVRTPGNNDADLLLTNDDLGEVSAMVERSKTRPES